VRARRWADDFDGPAGTPPGPRRGARRPPRAVVDDRPRRPHGALPALARGWHARRGERDPRWL